MELNSLQIMAGVAVRLFFPRGEQSGLATGCFEKMPVMLAGSGSREEDCTIKKIKPEVTPCKAKLRSTRFCEPKATPRRCPAGPQWLPKARKLSIRARSANATGP